MKTTTAPLRYAGALALALSALCAPAPASAQEAQIENGFALQVDLGARVNLLNLAAGGGNMVPTFSTIDTQLFAGGKLGRLVVGLGLEFFNGTQKTTTGNMSMTDSTSAFLIGPELQFALLRTADSRVELIGDVALHFGHLFLPNLPPNSPSNFLLSYQIGPGVRFWAHRHFALQGITGFAGELVHTIPPANPPPLGMTTTSDTSGHGILGQFGMLGVF
jgi:hypothetical protein